MITEHFDGISCIYAEDDHLTRELLHPTLTTLFDSVRVAENGRDALDMYHQEKCDIVITDIRMPLMDGLELARELAQEDEPPQVIVTTAHSDSEFLMEAIESDIDHYVLKPLEIPQLRKVVAKSVQIINYRKALVDEQKKKDSLLDELQTALTEIKTLRGFLPICAYCKNIRNDDGYWEKVEDYIHKNAGVDFSHSICPNCLKEHFPQYADAVISPKEQ